MGHLQHLASGSANLSADATVWLLDGSLVLHLPGWQLTGARWGPFRRHPNHHRLSVSPLTMIGILAGQVCKNLLIDHPVCLSSKT